MSWHARHLVNTLYTVGKWNFIELEEQIGLYWHHHVSGNSSYTSYPEAAVSLESIRTSLSVFFRGLGGAPGVPLTSGMQHASGHRLTLKQRLGIEKESMPVIERNSERVLLPAIIACFPDRDLNRRLYFWLAAFFAEAEQTLTKALNDPLQTDLLFLHQAHGLCLKISERSPALANDYASLCKALREQRPQRRRLPEQEQAVENVIQALLGKPVLRHDLGNIFLEAIEEPAPDFTQWHASANYQTFLPVPLWGKILPDKLHFGAARNNPDQSDGESHETGDITRKKSYRANFEQSKRDDPLLLNRFEKLFSWSEMLNINRAVQDDDMESALNAAKDLDEIALSLHTHPVATKLKFDLDLAPADANPTALIAELTYPEWDYRRKKYHDDQCRVIFHQAEENGELWTPDFRTKQRFRRIQRQFEAIRPKRAILRAQLDGNELDMDALVRTQCDFLANGNCADTIYMKTQQQMRDLSVAILVDVSLSTDSWIKGLRILDVAKEALITLATGLATCGDNFAIYTFTSRKRHFVQISSIKAFDEPYNDRTLRRISALRPGYYTRMGAALRHTNHLLNSRPERNRLILLLSDGKPNDLDYYEGRFGVEDTRRAILEARKMGQLVFGITIDSKAQNYFPYLFGKGGYAIVSRPDRLIHVLPIIYQQLVG